MSLKRQEMESNRALNEDARDEDPGEASEYERLESPYDGQIRVNEVEDAASFHGSGAYMAHGDADIDLQDIDDTSSLFDSDMEENA